MWRVGFCLFACFVPAILLAQMPEVKRIPVPDLKSAEEAEKTILDVYSRDFKNAISKEQRLALAQSLVKVAEATKEDAVARYMLFKMARDIAAKAGSLPDSVAAAQRMSKEFDIDPIRVQLEVAQEVSRVIKEKSDCQDFINRVVPFIDGLIAADRMDVAREVMIVAESVAIIGENPKQRKLLEVRSSEIQELDREYAGVVKEMSILKIEPENAKACASVGRYLCLDKGEWSLGLPLCLKCSETEIKELAKLDLDPGSDPIKLGDKWWEYASKLSNPRRIEIVQSRAIAWYGKGLASLDGLHLARVKKRIESWKQEKGEVRSWYLSWNSEQPLPPARPVPGGKAIVNSLGMKLVFVPAGEFRMGTDETVAKLKQDGIHLPEGDSMDDEGPSHRVRISKGFFLGQFEVTKRSFSQFVNEASYVTDAEKDKEGRWGYDARIGDYRRSREFSWRYPGWPQDDDHPVVFVSWNDANAFCRWLSSKEGRAYRLPTEAEWECACRAGTTTRFSTGDDFSTLQGFANARDATYQKRMVNEDFVKYPHCLINDSHVFTSPVGSFKPNRFGLCDMHGNVFEWCEDVYSADSFKARQAVTVDPRKEVGPGNRVLRGGSWFFNPATLRSSERYSLPPSGCDGSDGFRVLLESDDK